MATNEGYNPIWTNGTPGTIVATDPKYGAYGDGVHDDTAAIQAALDTGLDVVLPTGNTFLTSGSLTAQTGQTIYGYGATLKADGNYDALVIGGGKLFGLTITYTNSPSSGAAVSITGSNAWIQDIYVGPVSYNGIEVSGHAVFINNVHVHAANYGLYFTGSSLRVNGAFITGSVTAIYATGNTMNITSAELYGSNGVVWDGGSYCFLYDVEANGTGIAFSLVSGAEVHLNNCWTNNASNSLKIASTFNYAVSVTGGRLGNSTGDNVVVAGSQIISIKGVEIWGAAGNALVHVTGGVFMLAIEGNMFQDAGTSASYGILLDNVSLSHVSIGDNVMGVGSGTFTEGYIQNNSTDLSAVSIHDNIGFNPVGKLTAPALPASGTAQTNTFPYYVRVYVAGGTVSAIALNGTDTGLTSGEITLGPGETITLTYTAAPTWTWFGL